MNEFLPASAVTQIKDLDSLRMGSVTQIGDLDASAYTWQHLATIAGATAATLLIVQFLKLPLDKLWKIPTRAVAYAIALILMLTAQHFTTGLTWETTALAVVNAFVVALAAFGSYELTFAKSDQDKHKPD